MDWRNALGRPALRICAQIATRARYLHVQCSSQARSARDVQRRWDNEVARRDRSCCNDGRISLVVLLMEALVFCA